MRKAHTRSAGRLNPRLASAKPTESPPAFEKRWKKVSVKSGITISDHLARRNDILAAGNLLWNEERAGKGAVEGVEVDPSACRSMSGGRISLGGACTLVVGSPEPLGRVRMQWEGGGGHVSNQLPRR